MAAVRRGYWFMRPTAHWITSSSTRSSRSCAGVSRLARHICRTSRIISASRTYRREASCSRSWMRSSGNSILRGMTHRSFQPHDVSLHHALVGHGICLFSYGVKSTTQRPLLICPSAGPVSGDVVSSTSAPCNLHGMPFDTGRKVQRKRSGVSRPRHDRPHPLTPPDSASMVRLCLLRPSSEQKISPVCSPMQALPH